MPSESYESFGHANQQPGSLPEVVQAPVEATGIAQQNPDPNQIEKAQFSPYFPSPLTSAFILLSFLFYAVPAFQVEKHSLGEMDAGGNYDVCSYNYKCAHPYILWGENFHSINSIVSNSGYILGGLHALYSSTASTHYAVDY